MYCSQCGHEMPDEARFCGNCRSPLKGAASRIKVDFPNPPPTQTIFGTDFGTTAARPLRAVQSVNLFQTVRIVQIAVLALLILQTIFFFVPFCAVPDGGSLSMYGSLGKSLKDATTFSVYKLASQGSDLVFVQISILILVIAAICSAIQVFNFQSKHTFLVVLICIASAWTALIVLIMVDGVSGSSYFETTAVVPFWFLSCLGSFVLSITAHIMVKRAIKSSAQG